MPATVSTTRSARGVARPPRLRRDASPDRELTSWGQHARVVGSGPVVVLLAPSWRRWPVRNVDLEPQGMPDRDAWTVDVEESDMMVTLEVLPTAPPSRRRHHEPRPALEALLRLSHDPQPG